MLEVYRDEQTAPPQERALALKPKLRSWTGRVWHWSPGDFQLMLKLDANVAISEIGNSDLRAALAPFAAELTSFALYLDYTDEGKLPVSWGWCVQRRARQGCFHALLRFPEDTARASAGSTLAGGRRAIGSHSERGALSP
jgi:hypothetical protein